MADKFDVFLSYAAADDDFARALARALQERDLTVWFEEDQIQPGDMWVDLVQDALDESRSVIFVLGKGAAKSNWLAVELGPALASGKRIIPVIQEGIPIEELPGPIRRRKALLGDDPVTVAEAIARVVVGNGLEVSASA